MLLKKVNKAHTANGQVVIFKKTKSNNLLKLTIMKRNFTLTFAFLLLTVVFVHANAQTTLWSENFEGDWTANWYVENGTWEVGTPTSGPNAAYNGDKCAATVLGGNYAVTVDTRFIKISSFSVPSAEQHPRLRFWQWYSISGADYGKVQIKTEGSSDWVDVSENFIHTGSNVWTYTSIDLSDYAGQSVQIAFLFHAQDAGYGGDESTGWYIDDISLVTGTMVYNNPETWENGIGDWYAEKGAWQVGTPTSGPNEAYNGENCAATVLDGNYALNVDSRLISPPVTIASAEQHPRLRFWQWYSISGADYGKVQIKTEGSSDWVDVSENFIHTGSNVWTYISIDLSDYAGQSVQIAFLFHAQDAGYGGDESTGWYIDDISLVTGTMVYNNPETWENGIGDWYAEKGAWQVGTPTSGPNEAYNGENCAATVLDGNYALNVDSRLISPPVTIASAEQHPRLRFWQWYSISGADYGKVQIKTEGSSDWVDVSENFIHTGSNVWTYISIDLSDYAGQSVQIAFLFHAQDAGYGGDESTGWYIDDISLVTGTMVYNNPETWENGIGDWYAEKGAWQVGTPTSGPNEAYNGENCAATVLDGNYALNVDSRLISPPVTIASAEQHPRLRFWQWYSISGADYGKVQIKREGSSDWVDVSENFIHTGSNVWTYTSIDLSDYAGQSVQIAFLFHAQDAGYGGDESTGWYIDDISLVTGTMVYNNPETWENGIGDWYAEKGAWQVGTPTSGPNEAHNGENCAATVLDGNYALNVDSRLISPPVTIASAEQHPRLRFWQWYSISGADYGKVQIKTEGSSDWVDIPNQYINTGSSVWTYTYIDLSNYSEQSIQIAFLFHAQDAGYGGDESTGWYIDDITLDSDMASDETDILTYSFGIPPQTGAASIDEVNNTVDIEVESGTDVTGLVATFTLSDGANAEVGGVEQTSGTTSNDFSNPVTYTITAEDGTTTQDWLITVTKAVILNDEADILTYSFGMPPQTDDAAINSSLHTIDIEVEAGTNVTNLVATFTLSDGATAELDGVEQTSGTTSNDFSNPVTYTLTAEDGATTQDWVVTVTQAVVLNDETEILTYSFGIPPQTGNADINSSLGTIDIEVESGTDLTNLVSTFTLSDGASVKVGGVTQQSGTTANDFTNPVTYSVTAEDGSTIRNWVVTVTEEMVLNNETDILTYSFGIPPQTGNADINSSLGTIDIEVESGTDLTNLVSTFTLSDGASVKVGGVTQQSGTTANNFASPVTYSVTAEDGSTNRNWVVTVTEEMVLNNETDILTYSFGIPPQTGSADINSGLGTIDIEVESGTDLTNLVSTFTLSDGASVKVGGVTQQSGTTANNFTSPVTYSVTAEDGSTIRNWVVTVTEEMVLNNETDILTYSFGIPPQTGNADINSGLGTIDIEVESGTDLTNLVSTFTLSDGASVKVGGVTQQSGTTANNFTSPVTYSVTAEDGSTIRNWVVTVTEEMVLNNETDILTYSFGIPPQTGSADINSSLGTIDIEVESGTDLPIWYPRLHFLTVLR